MQRQVTRPGPLIFLARIPTETYVLTTLGSIALSALLFLRGQREDAVFVGQWAPTLLLLGLLYKRLRRSEAEGG